MSFCPCCAGRLRAFAYIADQYFATDSGAAARMFALTNMAMADSLITVWYGKIYFNFWRPMTAIRLGDSDGNSRTAGDPTWVPFIGTPNYPDYPSGANGLSGAATTMLANIFKTDRVPFQMTSVFVHPTTGARPTSPRMYGASRKPPTTSSTPASGKAFTSGRPTRMLARKPSTSPTGRSAITCARPTDSRRRQAGQPSARQRC